LFVPVGRVVVENVATPLLVVVKVAVPRAVVEPLLKKLTFPTAVDDETVAVKVTFWPWLIWEADGEIETVEAAREPPHAIARLFKSTEPRPVTRL
jgi:hypothetical protein